MRTQITGTEVYTLWPGPPLSKMAIGHCLDCGWWAAYENGLAEAEIAAKQHSCAQT